MAANEIADDKQAILNDQPFVKAKGRGRPRAFDHDQALERALQVFWQRGYEGASLNELTDALGINRPSLYAAFGNKEDLFRKALQRYLNGPAAYVRASLQQATPRQVVDHFLRSSAELLTNPDNPASCMIVQGALTCGEGGQAMQQLLSDYRNQTRVALQRRFEQAQADGSMAATLDAAALARYVATLHQGMSVQASSGATRHELLGVVDSLMQHWPTP